MPRPLARRGILSAIRAVPLSASLLLLGGAAPVGAQGLVSHTVSTVFDRLPDETSDWSRIGSAGAFVTESHSLLVNDNALGDCIAFQTMVGEIEAGHRVTVRTQVQVLENLGGLAVMIEISRPGLELLLQLDSDRVDVFERVGRGDGRWIAGTAADLSRPRQLELTKLAVDEDPRESLVVVLDGVEILRASGRGDGQLGVGRVVFGSLDFPSAGASLWSYLDVDAMPITVGGGVAVEGTTLGALKARYRP